MQRAGNHLVSEARDQRLASPMLQVTGRFFSQTAVRAPAAQPTSAWPVGTVRGHPSGFLLTRTVRAPSTQQPALGRCRAVGTPQASCSQDNRQGSAHAAASAWPAPREGTHQVSCFQAASAGSSGCSPPPPYLTAFASRIHHLILPPPGASFFVRSVGITTCAFAKHDSGSSAAAAAALRRPASAPSLLPKQTGRSLETTSLSQAFQT